MKLVKLNDECWINPEAITSIEWHYYPDNDETKYSIFIKGRGGYPLHTTKEELMNFLKQIGIEME